MRARWQRHGAVDILDLAALDALLDHLHNDAANTGRLIAVSLFHRDPGPVLTITVGAQHAAAQWSDLPQNNEMTSIANSPTDLSALPGAADITIEYGGHPSTLPARHFIPAETTRAAARTYFTTGQRPSEIPWPDPP